MNKVILLATFMPVMAFGQIMENFESGNINNWIQSPEGHWIADNTEIISGRFSLHHSFDNPDTGNDRIGLQLKNLHPSEGLTKWSFKIRHGYDPSSSNNWAVLLMSDTDPTLLLENRGWRGFAIGVNHTGYDDTLRLWKVKEGIFIPVVNTGINWQSDIGITDAIKIVAERLPSGQWNISVFRQNNDLVRATSGNDAELFDPGWFVISYKYSSTRDRLLWVDDISIEGVFYEDNDAPEVTGIKVTGKNSVEITFNEEPKDDIMIPSNFLTNPGNSISKNIIRGSGFSYRIEFNNQFMNKTLNSLVINTLCDKSGNCEKNISIEFVPVWAEPGDVIISEIMADPIPVVSLPATEYLEIRNRSNHPFNLKNWRLCTSSHSSSFPGKVIFPCENFIVCSAQDTSIFAEYGKTLGLKSFSTLIDGGMIIAISDSTGNMIYGVEYCSDWYRDELKAEGGWSLEMIDTNYPFYQDKNWGASTSRSGGTPGIENSLSRNNPDNFFSGILNVFPEDSTIIKVRFSETIIDLSAQTGTIVISDISIIDLHPVDLLYQEYSLKTEKPLQQGKIYSFIISENIKDFAGNRIQKNRFDFGIPESAENGDIMFNEILFNPLPGDADYVEFYNCSDKVIDVSRLLLVSINDATGDTSEFVQISPEKRCLLTDSYFAITTDKERMTERYYSSDPDKVFEIESLPSMTDNRGHLLLFNRELDIIDEVFYDEKMHFPLLSGNEGIALEKVRPQSLSSERSNWHSASESSGWGTPGAPNSVFSETPVSEDKVLLSSTKITPDNDGIEDILVIDLNLTGNGNVVSVEIFDETGGFIRKLANNLLSGPELSIIWDGTADDGNLVNTGIYIILISAYDDAGNTVRWKKVCTVIN